MSRDFGENLSLITDIVDKNVCNFFSLTLDASLEEFSNGSCNFEKISHTGKVGIIYIFTYNETSFIIKRMNPWAPGFLYFQKEIFINNSLKSIYNKCPNFVFSYYGNFEKNLLIMNRELGTFSDFFKFNVEVIFNFDINFYKSILFQIFAALYTMNNNLKLFHNDMHFNNIFFNDESEKCSKYIINDIEYILYSPFIFKIGDFGNSNNHTSSHHGFVPYDNRDDIQLFIKIHQKMLKKFFTNHIDEPFFFYLLDNNRLTENIIKKYIYGSLNKKLIPIDKTPRIECPKNRKNPDIKLITEINIINALRLLNEYANEVEDGYMEDEQVNGIYDYYIEVGRYCIDIFNEYNTNGYTNIFNLLIEGVTVPAVCTEDSIPVYNIDSIVEPIVIDPIFSSRILPVLTIPKWIFEGPSTEDTGAAAAAAAAPENSIKVEINKLYNIIDQIGIPEKEKQMFINYIFTNISGDFNINDYFNDRLRKHVSIPNRAKYRNNAKELESILQYIKDELARGTNVIEIHDEVIAERIAERIAETKARVAIGGNNTKKLKYYLTK